MNEVKGTIGEGLNCYLVSAELAGSWKIGHPLEFPKDLIIRI